MNRNSSLPSSPKIDGRHAVCVGNIYSRAQDQARTMQYAIRSGRPRTEGQKEKKQEAYDEGRSSGAEVSEGAKDKTDGRAIKKPRTSRLVDTNSRGKYRYVRRLIFVGTQFKPVPAAPILNYQQLPSI